MNKAKLEQAICDYIRSSGSLMARGIDVIRHRNGDLEFFMLTPVSWPHISVIYRPCDMPTEGDYLASGVLEAIKEFTTRIVEDLFIAEADRIKARRAAKQVRTEPAPMILHAHEQNAPPAP